MALGNHWFTHGANKAVDKNLHRRRYTTAWASLLLNIDKNLRRPYTMARASLLLSMSVEPASMRQDELTQTAAWYDGQVITFNPRQAAAP